VWVVGAVGRVPGVRVRLLAAAARMFSVWATGRVAVGRVGPGRLGGWCAGGARAGIEECSLVHRTMSSPPLPKIAADFKWIRDNADQVCADAERRGLDVRSAVDELAVRHAEYAEATARGNSARREQKRLDFTDPSSRAHATELKNVVRTAVAEAKAAEERLWFLARQLPNTTHPDVPEGSEENARVVRVAGKPRSFDFVPEDHVEIAARLGIVDFKAAANAAGRSFYYLLGAGALLELALVQYCMARVTAAGFTPVLAPDVARESTVANCGFQPRGAETQVYRLDSTHGDGLGNLCLVGTAEIPLAALDAGKILRESELPRRYAAFGHCFRAEAGGPGSESRGLYRVHQFSKVELFCITAEQDSEAELDRLLNCQTALCDELGLHYRVLDMPTLELGAPAYRKFDIEAWMPGRGEYGEICSTSNCTDFQSRRFGVRYRNDENGGTHFAHTLNGTAVAIPRLIVALLENGQQTDGTVRLPECLAPYMHGQTSISPRDPL